MLLASGHLWIRQAELLTLTCQISMSVPPVPALSGLVFILAVRGLLGRLGRHLRRGELIVIYVFLCLAISLGSGGALRQLLPNAVALQYFATPENGWAQYQRFLPTWVAPTGEETIVGLFEGSEAGVPWGEWLVPVGAWMVFVVVLFSALHFMAELFCDHWIDHERLSFPLNELPLMLTDGRQQRGVPVLWKDPVMWIGFSLATIHNGLSILHAFNPSVPALGFSYDVGALFHERPLSAMQPLVAYWGLEVLGFGYLMPLEVVNSALLAYGLLLAEAVTAAALGFDIPRFPHLEPQSAGAFVALAGILTWSARAHIAQQLRERPRVVWGLGIGMAGVVVWWMAAGMALWPALGIFFLVFTFTLSYSRLRAEAGVPIAWAYPVTEQHRVLYALFGSAPFEVNGSFRNLTIMSLGWFVSRGYLTELGAYQFEGLDLSRRSEVSRREMVGTLLLAVVIGALASFAMQLHTYYQYGLNFLEGGVHSGGMRASSAAYAFKMLEGFAKSHDAPNLGENLAALWGVVATVGLMALRRAFPAFPIHPLGFVLGTVRGYRTWASLGLAAIAKALALKIGGVGLYRRLIPAALGIVIGHFVMAGGLWSIVGSFGGEAFRAYQVWFG